MSRSLSDLVVGAEGLEALWDDGEFVFFRLHRPGDTAKRALVVIPAAGSPAASGLDCFRHEFSLKDLLGAAWALQPSALVHEHGQAMLVLADPGADPLCHLLGKPMTLPRFLRLATAVTRAVRGLHEAGLIHRDINPAHVVVAETAGEAWLTGFGNASRLPRERQASLPAGFIAGSLPYISPEQTGRMNRSVDSRSDLYTLGVVFYQMLTGVLPFTAAEPMEWVHCHIAKAPVPPHKRLEKVPETVSQLVMKLLAKTAEERYQTAAGIEHDLARCTVEWEAQGRVDAFALAEHDVPQHLLIPEKLYGRRPEVDALSRAFQRVVTAGTTELVLVSGYSGIGKSSLVNELQKTLVPSRGLFATGKFDQHMRDVPYATLAQAFHRLVQQILSRGEADLQVWRDSLLEALGPNGVLVTDLIPELELIIGKQASVPELPAQEAQRRFQTVMRRFIGAFAQPEHPLALFLDDLQWLDTGTLDLIADLLGSGGGRNLLLIGAYRDNEVDAAHPLARTLGVIRGAGGAVHDIVVAPLRRSDLGQMIADALHCDPEQAGPLARLVHSKTGGNPFFACQFMYALADEGELVFDHAAMQWSWDLDRIEARRFSDNVLELMVAKLNRLPAGTLEAVQRLACVGSAAPFGFLETICQKSREHLRDTLWGAVQAGLVVRAPASYVFQHDRIKEAAYSLIPVDERAEVHLQIGRLLLARTPPEGRHEIVFDIASQFNRSLPLITAAEEREQIAALNLVAGKRARKSAAYSSALTYFAAGSTLLAEDCWSRQYELAFDLEFHLAECEFLTGNLTGAEVRLSALAARAARLVDQAVVAALRADLYEVLVRSDRAADVALEFLRQVGFAWTNPTDDDVRQEYTRLLERLEERPIDTLIDLPLMDDATTRVIINLVPKILPAAISTDRRLHRLLIAYMVNLSLTYGNTDASCVGYGWLGIVLVDDFGRYATALQLGRLALDLVDQRGLTRFRSRVYFMYAIYIAPRVQSVRPALALLRTALRDSEENGDVTYIGYCRINIILGAFFCGEPLHDVEREVLEGIAFARGARSGFVDSACLTFLCLIRVCKGLPKDFDDFDGHAFDEVAFKDRLEADPNLSLIAYSYWIRRLHACVLKKDFAGGVEAARKTEALLIPGTTFVDWADHHYYAALAHVGCLGVAKAVQTDAELAHLEAVRGHHRQLQSWSETCPENFENRAALVSAELARLEGRELEAECLYQLAIRSAHTNGLVQNEALACELAAAFYAGRGFDDIAGMYLAKAIDGYSRWGADGKVRELRVQRTWIRPRDTTHESTPPDQELDVAAVVKASQALSSEMLLPRLIERLMTIALQNAGADRGLLLLRRDGEFHTEAEARTEGEEVSLQYGAGGDLAAPESIIRYVTRTQANVILDDAAEPNLFSEDPYLRIRRPRSVLCLPLVRQGALGGLLYLENTLASRVFTPERASLLELLASQAAISLENTRLYGDLQEREARVRRLIDANIIGMFTWTLEGRITDANDAFLRVVGYSREDVRAGRVLWKDLMPGEQGPADDPIMAELVTVGIAQPSETECAGSDGGRVPVLMGAALFDGPPAEGVAFVVDLREQKQAQRLARERDRQYHESQVELAHANRVATMGHLTASIVHEVNQPLTGVITNANLASRLLGRETPNIENAQTALSRIVRDGNRAAEVLSRIRGLIKKAPPQADRLSINDLVLETVALTHSEVVKSKVVLETRLDENLHLIQGDRVQLQQVILNLIMNALDAITGVEAERREILVSTRNTEAATVHVAVQDSGPGIATEKMDRIFDAFYTTKTTGMGMGLSICRSIIEAHGGKLWAGAAAPSGAVVQFTVPADTEK